MAADVKTENVPMGIIEFKTTPEFLALTSNQQHFVLLYSEHGDAREAVRAAYPRSKKLGESYVSQLLGKILAAPRVRAALSKYFGWNDKQKFLADLEANIRKAKGSDKVSLLALKAKLLGLANDVALPAAEEQQTFPVGSVVQQNGKLFRITAEEIEA